jgi:hypothetical protein
VVKTFEVDELGDVVFAGMADGILLSLVLRYAELEIVGDANVELLETVGENVDVGVVVHFSFFREEQEQRQRQRQRQEQEQEQRPRQSEIQGSFTSFRMTGGGGGRMKAVGEAE